MRDKVATALRWLFVINLGITFGAGLYEARISVPEWIGRGPSYHWNAEAARRMREDGLAQSQATSLALQWAKLNYLRLAIVLVAWLAALRALSLR